MALDLTATAAANGTGRRAVADEVVSADVTGALGRFRHLVAGSGMGTNVTADKVLGYDAAGELLDARRLAIQAAGGDEEAGLRRFEARQAAWLGRRQGFEDLWEQGRRLVYGTVNVGGMGAESFGPICVVVADPEHGAPSALAVFPGDSAQRYAAADGTVDTSAAVAAATAWADRAHLATSEHGAEAASRPEAEWPGVVCRATRYMEVVRAGELPLDRVAEVRLRLALLARLQALRAQALAGDTLTDVERNEAAAYDAVRRWGRTHAVTIAGVPDSARAA